jgi:thiol-disulfide isomerase/thioredoxin
MKRIVFFGLFILLTNLISAQLDKKAYLTKVLYNLEQIKSATYLFESSSSAPGDSMVFKTFTKYVKEFKNLTDTFIYSSYASFDPIDTLKLNYCYDGSMATSVNWDEETIRIDSFVEYKNLSFRPVIAPFFANIKGIIKYILNNSDSSSLNIQDFGDSIQISLVIFEKIVEINGKPMIFKSPNNNIVSRYDVWINKSNNLPFRMRRKMPHQTSFETCSNIHLNMGTEEEFIAANYIPAEFRIVSRGKEEMNNVVNDLEGKPAPDWVLKDINSKEFALKDLKSKIIIVQFTGIGCGPCHASIPFLKKLVTEYQNKDFQFISIESWSSNLAGIKRYAEMNKINYSFLISNKEITKKYQVIGVPVFFIIDKDRIIKKIILGYNGDGSTGIEIKETLNKLL